MEVVAFYGNRTEMKGHIKVNNTSPGFTGNKEYIVVHVVTKQKHPFK